MEKNLKGISLIVLVITIIVMIIIAGAIILSLNSSNIVEKAKMAKFKTNVSGYKEELSLSLANIQINDPNIQIKTINVDTPVQLKQYIPSMLEEDLNKYIIQNGELAYKLTIPEVERKYASEIGIARGIEHFENNPADTMYTTLYMNPNPPNPEVLFKENITEYNTEQGYDLYFENEDGSSNITFSAVKGNTYDSEIKFPFSKPFLCKMANNDDENDVALYFWEDYKETKEEDGMIMIFDFKKGWNNFSFIDDEENNTIKVIGTAISIDNLPKLENAGKISASSFYRIKYMGYYLSTVEY